VGLMTSDQSYIITSLVSHTLLESWAKHHLSSELNSMWIVVACTFTLPACQFSWNFELRRCIAGFLNHVFILSFLLI
jgi:hypothetical protein